MNQNALAVALAGLPVADVEVTVFEGVGADTVEGTAAEIALVNLAVGLREASLLS